MTLFPASGSHLHKSTLHSCWKQSCPSALEYGPLEYLTGRTGIRFAPNHARQVGSGTRKQKEVGRGECPWAIQCGVLRARAACCRVPRANLQGLSHLAQLARIPALHPRSQACNSTQCCTRILPAWFRPQLLRPLQLLSTSIDRRPSTIRRPPPALSFFRSAGTLLLLLLREARHLQLHPRFVSSRPQKTPCLVWSRIKRVSVSVFLLIFLVHCQPTSERKPQTTRAAQCLATSAHNPSQLRPGLSATGAIAIPCVDRLALAQSPRPPDARSSPERHSLFHLRLLPSPGRGKITQITQNVSITPPTRAHGSVP